MCDGVSRDFDYPRRIDESVEFDEITETVSIRVEQVGVDVR